MTPEGGTVADALGRARALGIDRLDSQLLLASTLQRTREWLIAHGDAALSAAQQRDYAAGCRRRAAGEPLAYLLGVREFHGLLLRVTPDVLVPRPETETLVDWALELLGQARVSAAQVVDLGTGSGAIALALKHRHPRSRVCAVDSSPAALELARANAHTHGLDIEFLLGDWWQPLAGRRFDLVAANPPYIAIGDPHLGALRHEPASALVGGADALAAIDRIVLGAPTHLSPGGWLLLEHGHDQAAAVRRRLGEHGLVDVQTRADLAGLPRCTVGRLRQ